MRSILKQRASSAGLEYYRPHSFRHAAVHLALKQARTAEEVGAISQNFGHEHIGTTLLTYGKLDDDRVEQVVRGIDFSSQEAVQSTPDKIDMIYEMMRKAMEKERE
jgi:integrase/recombinase XerD